MTGEEFLNKVRSIKIITDIHWCIEGDYFEPDLVKLIAIADGEEIEVTYPRGGSFMQSVAMALIINKFMEQIGNDFRTNVGKDIAKAVTFYYSVKQI